MKPRFALFALLLAAAGSAGARTIELEVNGLVCAFCAQGIEKTLKAFPETAGVLVSLEHRLVALELRPGQDIEDDRLEAAIKDAGYTTVKLERTERTLQTLRQELKAHGDDD